MRQNPQQQLQDFFLQHLYDERVPVDIYLTSGICLTGEIAGFDPYVILLSGRGIIQQVYKHGASTIVPREQIDFRVPEDALDYQGTQKGRVPFNMQDQFLKQLRQEQVTVKVFLANGIMLPKRRVHSYDQYAVMFHDLTSEGGLLHMTYKSVIGTIQPPPGFKPKLLFPVREVDLVVA